MKKIVNDLKPDLVVIASQWSRDVGPDFQGRLGNLVRELKVSGARSVVVLGPFPIWSDELYRMAIRHFLANGAELPERSTLGLDSRWRVSELLKEASKLSSAEYIPVDEYLCGVNNDQGCLWIIPESKNNDLITFDNGHLTQKSSEWFVQKYIAPELRRLIL